MPRKTPDQLKEKATALRKKLAEKRSGLNATALRSLKKRIRRVQRKRRGLVAPKVRAKAPAPEAKSE